MTKMLGSQTKVESDPGLSSSSPHLTKPVRVHVCFYPDEQKVEPQFYCLNVNEQRQAARFQFPNEVFRYSFRRSAIKRLLAKNLGIVAEDVQVQSDELGRPILLNSLDNLNSVMQTPNRHIGISRTSKVFVFAISENGPIGTDVEDFLRPIPNWMEIAIDFFHSREVQYLYKTKKISDFFRIWIRKESYLKLGGLGLRDDLKRFCVLDEDDELGSRVQIDQDIYQFAHFAGDDGSEVCLCSKKDNCQQVECEQMVFQTQTQGLVRESSLDRV